MTAFDHSTFIASISTSKAIIDRVELDTELTFTAGSRKQLVDGYGVQFNGYRPPTGEVLNNRHTLAAATTHYKYRLVDHELFQLSLAPGAQLSYYALRISSETVQNTLKQLDAGLGVKFETVINLNHHLQLVADTALYDSRARDVFYKNNISLRHKLNKIPCFTSVIGAKGLLTVSAATATPVKIQRPATALIQKSKSAQKVFYWATESTGNLYRLHDTGSPIHGEPIDAQTGS